MAGKTRRTAERPEPDDDEPGPSPERRRATPRKRGRRRRKGGLRLGRVAYWGAVAALWLVIAAIGMLFWVGSHLPPIQSLEIPKRPPSIQIVGLDGARARRPRRDGRRRGADQGAAALPAEGVRRHRGPPLLLATTASIRSASRAPSVANVLHRGVAQGGSTITQQLAKNLFLTQERTLARKLQEVVLALWLERKFSKEEILELYLNRVYFGAGAYGVEAAAQRYFGKSARQVTLAEAALLAGLVKSPSRLAPTTQFRRRRAARPDGARRHVGCRLRHRTRPPRSRWRIRPRTSSQSAAARRTMWPTG